MYSNVSAAVTIQCCSAVVYVDLAFVDVKGLRAQA